MVQNNAPSTEFLDTIARLERRIAALEGRTLRNVVIPEGGLTLRGGGNFVVENEDGTAWQFYLIEGGDGRREMGITRDNGQFVLRTFGVGVDEQAWALHDNANTIVFSDDAASSQGIARPWIPIPFQVSTWTEGFGKATSGSFTTVAEARGYKQHPKAIIALRTGAVAGVGGAWRVLVNGVESASGSIPVGSFALDYVTVDVPGTHMSIMSIDIQVRVTSGAGAVGAMVRDAYGRET